MLIVAHVFCNKCMWVKSCDGRRSSSRIRVSARAVVCHSVILMYIVSTHACEMVTAGKSHLETTEDRCERAYVQYVSRIFAHQISPKQ